MQFKLQFRSLMYGFPPQRALIIAVSNVPGMTGWLNAALALEDGRMLSMPITVVDFNTAERNSVTMVEDKNPPPAPLVIYPGR